jgi:tRNA-2-methylthio-N6-dimethylallyladenosine synthase
MPKVYLETYGCQMNEYDSELIRAILRRHNYEFTEHDSDADVVLLNTCAIRENAHQKIFGRLGHLKPLKKKRERMVIGVLGCMAQNLREELAKRVDIVDIVAGPDSYKKLPRLIATVLETGDKGFDFKLSEFEDYSDVYPSRVPGVNAWIAVMRGCDNFCTFCVVPYTRGRERSRSPESVVRETELLAAEGFRQVTLLGQNVNSYRHEQYDFGDLLEMVAAVDGIQRVRFTSPHPKDFPDKFLEVMARNTKICHQIHLPLQAGNDRILQLMNRTYTRREFLDLVDKIRRTIPDVVLSTDIIVGFCTETDEEFEDTVAVMQEVEFDSAFIFKYSQRKNTIAYRKYPDDVPPEKKTERIQRLNEIQKEISLKRNRADIGRTFEILVEGPSKKDQSEWMGRTEGNKIVVYPHGEEKPGDLIHVTITDVTAHTLFGRRVDADRENRSPIPIVTEVQPATDE